MKKQMIVDIGRFAITYSVINELDQRLEYFKVDLMAEIDYLFAKRGSSFIAKVVDTTRRLIATYEGIEKVIYVIPSKDLLMVSAKELTPDIIVKETERIFDIKVKGDLIQAVATPYTNKGKFYTPVTIYDNNLDLLIKEINLRDDVPIGEGPNRLRADVYFQTTMGRLMEKASRHRGRVALIDAGFFSTRVLLSDDGVPVDYVEFTELSGERMLQYVYSKTETKLMDILNLIVNSKNLRENSIQEIQLADEFIETYSTGLREYLGRFNLDDIIVYGGLGAMDLVGNSNKAPVEVVNLAKGYQSGVPEHFNYRIVYNNTTTHKNSILDSSNLEIILGNSEYKKVRGIEENEKHLALKDAEKTRQIHKKDSHKSIKLDENDDEILLEQVSSKDTINEKSDSRNKKSSKEKIMGKIRNRKEADPIPENMLDLIEAEGKVKKKSIENISSADNKELDKLKKKQKKYRRSESKAPIVTVAVFMSLLLVMVIFFMNVMGFVSIKPLEKFGIITNERQVQVNGINEAMSRTAGKICKDFELHPTRLPIRNSYDVVRRTSKTTFGIPLDFEMHEELINGLEKRVERLESENEMSIERKLNKENGFHYLVVTTKLGK